MILQFDCDYKKKNRDLLYRSHNPTGSIWKHFYFTKLLAVSIIIWGSVFAGNSEMFGESIFISENPIDNSCPKFLSSPQNKEYLLRVVKSVALQNQDRLASNVETRRRGAFLLTGVIVYHTTRVVGHASVWISAGAMIIGGAVTGGPAGAGAAYLGALTMIAPASAAVETASLAIGTAASFIPGLP